MRARAFPLFVTLCAVGCTPIPHQIAPAEECAPDDVMCVPDGGEGSDGSAANGSGGTGASSSSNGSAGSGGSANRSGNGNANGTSGNGGNGANGANGRANGSANGSRGGTSAPAVCGNGMVEMGETCDPASTCPTLETCTSTNLCLKPMLIGSPTTCDVKCELVPNNACAPGDGCCPKACNSTLDSDCSDSCGNGVIDKSETCEPMNPAMPCPASCDDSDPCTKDVQTGSPEQCNVVCTHQAIKQPAPGDKCCPPGADGNNDTDCAVMCGNQVKEPGETCDGDCPETCDDKDPCTTDKSEGSAADCTIECTNTPITQPEPGDGCCPMSADATSDADCSAMCGNGVKEGSEKCDGPDCPTSCDDDDPCTMDIPVGSAAKCTAECTHKPITSPAPGDGCCPPRANANNDSDCKPVCGNDVKEQGETCDGATCTMNCNDNNKCTNDHTVGSAASCDVECANDPIVPCCGNGKRESGETCDGADCKKSCTTTRQCMRSVPVGSAANCDADCREEAQVPCCGNGDTEFGETCDGDADCKQRVNCDDGNPCTQDTYAVGTSAAACNLRCGEHKPIGGSGVMNECGGCSTLPSNFKNKGICTPATSSRPECAIAGVWECVGENNVNCKNQVVNVVDGCEPIPMGDDDCDGRVDENAPGGCGTPTP